LNGCLEFPDQSNHPADDAKFASRQDNRSILLIFWFKCDDAVIFKESLEGCFAVDQGADDLTVFGRALLFDDDSIAVLNARPDHAVAFDLESEHLSRSHVAGHCQISFNIFFAQKRFARWDPAQNRYFSGGDQRGFTQDIRYFNGTFADAADVALLFQGF
jgi:hypothetical protein